MSAWVLGNNHIEYIVELIAECTSEDELHGLLTDCKSNDFVDLLDCAGNALANENIKSYKQEYETDDVNRKKYMFSGKFTQSEIIANPYVALKVINCYIYQTCRSQTWEDSYAFSLIEIAKRRVLEIVQNSNEYLFATGWPIHDDDDIYI